MMLSVKPVKKRLKNYDLDPTVTQIYQEINNPQEKKLDTGVFSNDAILIKLGKELEDNQIAIKYKEVNNTNNTQTEHKPKKPNLPRQKEIFNSKNKENQYNFWITSKSREEVQCPGDDHKIETSSSQESRRCTFGYNADISGS